MSDAWQSTFISRIPDQNSNVTSVTIPSNDTMVLVVKNGTDPQDVINGLQTWMMYVSGLNIKYSIVNITLNVQSSKLNQVISQLPQGDVVITDVSGSTEKNIQNINNMMPAKSDIILFCGLLGMVTGLAGMFIDSILNIFERVKKMISQLKR